MRYRFADAAIWRVLSGMKPAGNIVTGGFWILVDPDAVSVCRRVAERPEAAHYGMVL
jgi:hypothetical protein